MWVLLAATLGPSTAEASCQYLVRRANASSRFHLARNFTSLAKCSQQEAEASFNGLLLARRVSIHWSTSVWPPSRRRSGHPYGACLSHDALDYDVRDQVATVIGREGTENLKIVAFLKGAYFGLRDLEFQQWDDALVAYQDSDWETGSPSKPRRRRPACLTTSTTRC